MDKKRQILGILWSRTKRSKTQYNKGAGKEIILLKYMNTMTPTAHGATETNFFLSFFYCSPLQKDFGQKNLFVYYVFLRFKMLHFPPPSGECCSRSKGHVTGPHDVRSCVVILLL